MSTRPEEALEQLGHPASGAQRLSSPRQCDGPDPTRPAPGTPAYPDIPRQRSRPAYEGIPEQWRDAPPAGLDAPMPVPTTRTVRHVVLGVAGLCGVVALLVVGGLVLTTTPPTTTIGAWSDGGGLQRLTDLSEDLAAAEQAGQAADLAGVGTACLLLQFHTAAAQDYEPIPDAEAQRHWAAALAHLAHASTNCVAAVRDRDSDLFIQVSEELGTVPADVSQVIKRLSTLY